jgi:hypothetical protein
MRKSVTLSVRGKRSEWAIDCHMSQGQIDAMNEDGIEVFELHHSIPMWAVDLGLTRPWCFVQDVFNFRNPFHK